MKLYKLSILALALAGTMAACSDDDDYNVPASTPGAYFPATSPDVVELPQEGDYVDITIMRSGVSGDQTVNLTSTDESGLFNIPSTVTFTGNETSTTLHVTFDASKIVQDEEYPASITIDGASNSWGITKYDFAFSRVTPIDITKIGKSIWLYGGFLTGGGYFNVVKQVNPNKPNLETYVVEKWFDYPDTTYAFNLNLIVHKDLVLPNGYPVVELPQQALKFTDSYPGVRVMGYIDYVSWRYKVSLEDIANVYHFGLQTGSGTTLLTPEQVSYFDTDKGVFHIYDSYFIFDENGEWDGRWTGIGEEQLILPGYPDYDIAINYLGYFTGEDETMKAVAELYAGEDVETVDIYNIEGDDVESALASIENGSVEPAQTLKLESAGFDDNITIDIPGPGTYTMIAVIYAEDEIQGYDYSTYTISGAPAVKWQSVGTGVYIDGWVLPAYAIKNEAGENEQVNPFNYPWNVQIEKNPDVEGEYRMVSPYTQSGFALVGQNENTKATNIIFNIADPDWPYLAFQASGFSDGDMLWISDINWFYNNVQGYTKDQILNSNFASRASYYENNILEIPRPLFAMSGNNFSSSLDDLGYSWNGPGEDKAPYPTRLTMPSGTKAQTVAKALKRQVSNDDFVRSIHASKVKFEKNSRNGSVRLNNKVTMMTAF